MMLNHMLLINGSLKIINKKRNLKIPGNENKNTTIQNLCDAAKAVLMDVHSATSSSQERKNLK